MELMPNSDIITLSIGRIVIIRHGNQKQFFKLNDDNTMNPLSKEEMEVIHQIFYPPKSPIKCVEVAWEIAKNNPTFSINQEGWRTVISNIESVIPEDARNNFYRNLQSVQIEVTNEEETRKDTGTMRAGYYNPVENKLCFSEEALQLLKSMPLHDGSDGSVRALSIVVHELLHMASSHYDKDTGIVRSGMDILNTDGTSISANSALTEGITENLAALVVEKIIGKPMQQDVFEISGYQKQMLVAGQMQLLCNDDVLSDYFKAEGTTKTREKIKEYIANNELSEEIVEEETNYLFSRIEDSYLLQQFEHEDNFSSSMPHLIQNTMLTALSGKLDEYIQKGIISTPEHLNDFCDIFQKKMLISENGVDSKKYPRVDGSKVSLDVKKQMLTSQLKQKGKKTEMDFEP